MGAAIAAAASPSFARAADCAITYTADNAIGDVIEREHFGFDGYDALCSALKAEHLKVSIDADKGVLGERAYAWVTIRLVRETTTSPPSSSARPPRSPRRPTRRRRPRR